MRFQISDFRLQIVGWVERRPCTHGRETHAAARPTLRLPLLSFLFAALCAITTLTPAQQAAVDELMQDRGGDPAAEIDRELFGPKMDKPADKDDQNQDLKRRLDQELGEAAVAEDENPLLGIARQMHAAGELLDAQRVAPAAEKQRAAVDALDRLIRAAKKNCKSGSCQSAAQAMRTASNLPKPSSSSNMPKAGRPAGEQQAERKTSTTPQRLDPAELQALVKRVWGDLPQRVREQMQQLPAEEFVPQYDMLIEEYYRRLAEEKR